MRIFKTIFFLIVDANRAERRQEFAMKARIKRSFCRILNVMASCISTAQLQTTYDWGLRYLLPFRPLYPGLIDGHIGVMEFNFNKLNTPENFKEKLKQFKKIKMKTELKQKVDYKGTLLGIAVGKSLDLDCYSPNIYTGFGSAASRLHSAGTAQFQLRFNKKNNKLTIKRLQ